MPHHRLVGAHEPLELRQLLAHLHDDHRRLAGELIRRIEVTTAPRQQPLDNVSLSHQSPHQQPQPRIILDPPLALAYPVRLALQLRAQLRVRERQRQAVIPGTPNCSG